MDVAQMQRLYVDFGNSIYREGYLDTNFTRLQELSDENHPKFVHEVVSDYFKTAEPALNNLTNALENLVTPFDEVVEMVHTLKGSSCSVGAKKVSNICIMFKKYSEERNLQECVKCLHQVKQEFAVWRSKLETLLTMQREIMEAGGVVPVIE